MHTPVILALLACPTTALASWEVGVVPATQKVLPDTAVPEDTGITLGAGLNEQEGFQVLVRDEDGLVGVDMTISDLSGTDGATIDESRLELFREHYFEIEQASAMFMGEIADHPREPGRHPDPLIPFDDPWAEGELPVGAPFDVPAGETWAVWVGVHVPIEAEPG